MNKDGQDGASFILSILSILGLIFYVLLRLLLQEVLRFRIGLVVLEVRVGLWAWRSQA